MITVLEHLFCKRSGWSAWRREGSRETLTFQYLNGAYKVGTDFLVLYSDFFSNILCISVSKPAPYWEGTAVINGEFKELKLTDYEGKYLVFFFYPLDFTFVCPTEIIAFSDRIEEFRAINTEVVACSVDSKFTHLAWYGFFSCLSLNIIHSSNLAKEQYSPGFLPVEIYHNV
uniref:thioredoxin-dependent peroxiredoxin n=1 Tax=Serinus canaria TaxID=9135 RepID=A0A8C9NLH2_SERCA